MVEEWPREGIAKRWPARARAIRALRSTPPPDPMTDVTSYNARTDLDNDLNLVPRLDYASVGAIRQSYAIADALECESRWPAGLAHAVSYLLFADRLYYFWPCQQVGLMGILDCADTIHVRRHTTSLSSDEAEIEVRGRRCGPASFVLGPNRVRILARRRPTVSVFPYRVARSWAAAAREGTGVNFSVILPTIIVRRRTTFWLSACTSVPSRFVNRREKVLLNSSFSRLRRYVA